MSSSITSLIYLIGLLAGLSVLYHLLPFRNLPAQKPRIAFFPKYKWTHDKPAEVRRRLADHGFKEAVSGVFLRGSYLGDFSLRIAKMRVTLNEEGHARIGSGGVFIAFDTGDTWQLATELKGR
ncbi:MAG: hypothetical protein H6883_11215 [Rhodobiaceae bacterium]|nr:hypothetical protein [Rhodobiaceae bacterium]